VPRPGAPDHLLIAFAYRGTGTHGVWPQPNVPTVGAALLDRLEQALGRRPEALAVTARTDTGVHARLNLATVRLWRGPADTSGLDQISEPRSDGITAARALRTHPTVYARGLAVRKRYVYAWSEPLDAPAMAAGARHLVGTHDLAALRGRRVDPGRCVGLTLDRVEIRTPEPGRTELLIEGERFVRHQVRITAALLAQVGRGERPPDDVARVIASRDVRHGAWPAPGEGLTLAALELAADRSTWVHSPEQVDLHAVAEECHARLSAGSTR